MVDKQTESLRQTNLNLEQEIKRRRETEISLNDAKQAAEAASHAKSRFLANTSHEIRTPLNGIIGITSLLKDTRLDDEQSGFVETIRASGDLLLGLISNILDLSKIESQALELESAPFDLKRTIDQCIEIASPEAIRKGINIVSYIPEKIPTTYTGDSTRFRQILLNLLNNAVKFTSEGGVMLIVSTDQTDEGKEALFFSIRDTGICIPNEAMQRIFKAFSQVDSSTTRKYGGTGLGLAICQSLTKLMGGGINVHSEQGQGSNFTFWLPLKSGETHSTDHTPPFASKRVIYLGGHEALRPVTISQLDDWGMQVEQFPNAQHDQAFRESDLVIVDCHDLPVSSTLTVDTLINQKGVPEERILLLHPHSHLQRDHKSRIECLLQPTSMEQLRKCFQNIFSNKLTPEPDSKVTPPTPKRAAQKNVLRILIAEDNEVNQRILQLMLNKLGLSCDIVENGAEAVKAYSEHRHELIFMDVQMPVMDGLEATREIRTLTSSACSPYIIAVSANAFIQDRDKGFEAGVNDYITKPVRIEDLENSMGLFYRRQDAMQDV